MKVYPPPIFMTRSFRGVAPRIAPSAYVDDAATLIGEVEIGERSSIWPGVVMRGDTGLLKVGNDTNIQDGSVVHTDEGISLILGDRVTVGHMVMLHGCVVGDDALIGIGSIVLNNAKVGKGAVVAAGALVPEGMEIPDGMLAMGVPAKVRREVTAEERERFASGMRHYVNKAAIFKKEQGAG